MRYAIVFLLVGFSLAASGQGVPVLLDPEVKVGRLDNGFTYYLRHFAGSPKKVEMRLVVKAGNLQEDPDQLGLAHLLEHMAFNGTVHYPADALHEQFGKWGLKAGNDWNASTGTSTQYWLTLPTDNAEIYRAGFQIMRDWAQGMTLEPDQIDAERGVVLGESRPSHSPVFQLEWRRNYRLLNNPRYDEDYSAKHDAYIKSFKHAPLIRFYRDWYRPDLQALIVVGDIDVQAVDKLVRTLFSDMVMPEKPRAFDESLHGLLSPLTGKNRSLTMISDGQSDVRLELYMKARNKSPVPVTTEDFRTELMDRLWARMAGERVAEINRRADVESGSIQVGLDRAILHPAGRLDAIVSRVSVNEPAALEAAVTKLMQLLEQVRRQGFTSAELALAREKLTDELRIDAASKSTAAGLTGAYARHFTEGAAAPFPDALRQLQAQLLDTISLENINAHARDWIRTDRDFDTVIFAPPKWKSRLPSERRLQALFAGVRSAPVPAWTEPPPAPVRLMEAAQVAGLPTGSVVKTDIIEEIGVTDVLLGNGIRILLKPTWEAGKKASGRLNLNGFRPGGWTVYPEDEQASAYATHLFSGAGIGEYDRFQVAAFTGPRNIIASLVLDEEGAKINGRASVAELESMLQLVYLSMMRPHRDESAFSRWKERTLREYRAEQQPTTLFGREIERLRYEGSDLRFETADDFGRVDLGRAYAIFQDRFSRAGDFVFVITGDFIGQDVLPLLTRYLGALPSGRSSVPAHAIAARTVRMAPVEKTLRIGSSPQEVNVVLALPGTAEDTLLNRIKLEILGETLQMVMRRRLREQEGGTYAPWARMELAHASKPGSIVYTFKIEFNTAPGNQDHMIAAAREEISRLRAQGLEPSVYEAVLAQAREEDSHPYGWNGYLCDQVAKGADLTQILKRSGILGKTITLEMMNAAAREFLADDTLQRFVMLPAE